MNAPHEEASEFAKQSKRENRVYVGNLSYDVKYRDLMEFMRGGGLGKSQLSFWIGLVFRVVVADVAVSFIQKGAGQHAEAVFGSLEEVGRRVVS
jgi:hypothetical protein